MIISNLAQDDSGLTQVNPGSSEHARVTAQKYEDVRMIYLTLPLLGRVRTVVSKGTATLVDYSYLKHPQFSSSEADPSCSPVRCLWSGSGRSQFTPKLERVSSVPTVACIHQLRSLQRLYHTDLENEINTGPGDMPLEERRS